MFKLSCPEDIMWKAPKTAMYTKQSYTWSAEFYILFTIDRLSTLFKLKYSWFFSNALLNKLRSFRLLYFTRYTRLHTYHICLKAGSLRTLATIREPWIGGLEYNGRMRILTWDITLSASSLEPHTIVKAPALSPTTCIYDLSFLSNEQRIWLDVKFIIFSMKRCQKLINILAQFHEI